MNKHLFGQQTKIATEQRKFIQKVELFRNRLIHGIIYSFLFSVSSLFISSCGNESSPIDNTNSSPFILPKGAPAPIVPSDNPITAAKIELGRKLFFDSTLSVNYTVACASCHNPDKSFTDGLPVSPGVMGEQGFRNAPTLINAGYLQAFAWDGAKKNLEEQSLGAMLNPVEMQADTAIIAERLRKNSDYQQLFERAFGANSGKSTEISAYKAAQAIATFMRTIIAGNSRYDRFLLGDTSSLTANEKRGLNLFMSSKAMCNNCHVGWNLTDDKFHSTGLYANYLDKGRYLVTNSAADVAKFKTPTLRNIARTSPYMHDGSRTSLREVLEHYNRGGFTVANKDTSIRPLKLSNDELLDLEAFLGSLTDETIEKNTFYRKQ